MSKLDDKALEEAAMALGGDEWCNNDAPRFREDARTAVQTYLDALPASKEAALSEIRAELERERERNRRLHRRAQISEAINQSVEGILAIWKDTLKDRYAPQNQKWLLFSFALDDIVKQREKITARAASQGEGEER